LEAFYNPLCRNNFLLKPLTLSIAEWATFALSGIISSKIPDFATLVQIANILKYKQLFVRKNSRFQIPSPRPKQGQTGTRAASVVPMASAAR
jgi:hypothetical protein